MNNSRPKIIVSVFIFNSDGSKILVGKRYEEGAWGTVSGKLDYGEGFEECVSRILCNMANLLIEEPDKLKFMCTYNAVDKENNIHIVGVDYYYQVSKEEEKSHIMIDPYFFQSWSWYSFEEILKMYDNLYFGMRSLFKKFNIKSLDDIKSLVSN